MKKGITVLMYHALTKEGVFDAETMNPADKDYLLECSGFERQLAMFEKRKLMVSVPAPMIAEMSTINIANAALPTYDGSMLITFDDSWQSHLSVALPILSKFDYKAIFFITLSQLGKKNMLTEKEVRELAANGAIIGSHGMKHCYFDELDSYQLRNELADSKKALSDMIGKDVHTLALPGGREHPNLLAIAKEEGYSHIFGSCPGAWRGEDLVIPRIPITHCTSDAEFEMLLDNPGKLFLKRRMFFKCKKVLREIIGNRNYDKLRRVVKGDKNA